MKDLFILVALVWVLAGFWSYVMYERHNCHERGGALVRGVVLYECVAGAK